MVDPAEIIRERFESGQDDAAGETDAPGWPDPLDPAALYGVAGDFVELISPQSESDPAALLLQFLVLVGIMLGRHVFRMVESTAHHTNLFLVLVGPTGHGRKGTSFGHVKRIAREIDVSFGRCVRTGLVSGEGLIHTIRDPIIEVDDKGKERIVDRGVEDKRALFYAPEFSAILKVCSREGNTLSDVIRAAWDSEDLQIASRNAPAIATKPHVGVVGHISSTELRELMTELQGANGFSNRFLFACVQRANILPFGGNVDADLFNPIRRQLDLAMTYARNTREQTRFSPEAAENWIAAYPELSRNRSGLRGQLCARAEAQVLRLALLYSALDALPEILPEHLAAAMAVWDYCEDSVNYVFHDGTGNPMSDRILVALQSNKSGCLTRTEISALFANHAPADEIDRALGGLAALGLAKMEQSKTTGRPVQRWYLTQRSGRNGRGR